MYEKAERDVSDEQFKQSYIIGSDPEHPVGYGDAPSSV